MYDINDEGAAIATLQRYLYAASERDTRIPLSPIDSVYGDETRAAVEEYQRLNSLEVTGIADMETFNSLFRESQRWDAERESKSTAYAPQDFPLKPGSYGSDVERLHIMLCELSEYYELGELPRGDFYGPLTYDAIKRTQRIFIHDESGEVDELYLARLQSEVQHRKKFQNRNKSRIK